VDDDVRVEAGFVSAHAANYADPDIMAVAGSVLGPERKTVSKLPAYLDAPYAEHYRACWQYATRRRVAHAPGGNMSFRAEVCARAGLFDERYRGPAFREETDFFMRVYAENLAVIYDPACWVIHAPGIVGGGCWEGFDGVPPVERFANHAYFVLKNFPRRAWVRLFAESVRDALVRRDLLRRPRTLPVKLYRLVAGWARAARTAPRHSTLTRRPSAFRSEHHA
jgi:hypothetical protein